MEVPASAASVIESVRVTSHPTRCSWEKSYTISWTEPTGSSGIVQVPFCERPGCAAYLGWPLRPVAGVPSVLISTPIPVENPVATVYILVWAPSHEELIEPGALRPAEARIFVGGKRTTGLVESGPGIFPVPIEEADIYAPLDDHYARQLDDALKAWLQAGQ